MVWVTVAEYVCFVRAGHKQPSPCYCVLTWEHQLATLDHPVVCVSWDDATTYAEWLSERTCQPWRLPSEEEWEKAGRGTDGRLYPWGNAFDTVRCNAGGADSPVGNYPSGASPYGVQDMEGIVKEWTSSRFLLYEGAPDITRYTVDQAYAADALVVRGKTGGLNAMNAVVARRGYLSRKDTLKNLGFRLVRAASYS
jgi:formylglycine-generating enzyme required for sulfatase activity